MVRDESHVSRAGLIANKLQSAPGAFVAAGFLSEHDDFRGNGPRLFFFLFVSWPAGDPEREVGFAHLGQPVQLRVFTSILRRSLPNT